MEEKMTFETALKQLEVNAEKMASPELPLEESVKLYSESVKLIDFCQKSLEEAKIRIETLEGKRSEAVK